MTRHGPRLSPLSSLEIGPPLCRRPQAQLALARRLEHCGLSEQAARAACEALASRASALARGLDAIDGGGGGSGGGGGGGGGGGSSSHVSGGGGGGGGVKRSRRGSVKAASSVVLTRGLAPGMVRLACGETNDLYITVDN